MSAPHAPDAAAPPGDSGAEYPATPATSANSAVDSDLDRDRAHSVSEAPRVAKARHPWRWVVRVAALIVDSAAPTASRINPPGLPKK